MSRRAVKPGTVRCAPHLAIPAIAPALFFLLAATPVEVLGCRLRGLLAFGIALGSGIAGVAAAAAALRARVRGDADADRLILVAVILAVPVVALLALA